jgi:hypothetical protein
MSDVRWVRFTAAAGITFGVLGILAAQAQGSRPSLDDSSREIFRYISEHQGDLQVSAALFGGAMVVVLFWAWGLFSALRKADSGRSGLAVLAVAGGVLAAATTVASSTVIATAAIRIDELGPAGARVSFTLYQLTQVATNAGLAVLIGAAAIVSSRRGLFARWFTIASIIVAIASFVGVLGIAYAGDTIQIVAGIALILDVVWIVLVSVRLWRTPELAVA